MNQQVSRHALVVWTRMSMNPLVNADSAEGWTAHSGPEAIQILTQYLKTFSDAMMQDKRGFPQQTYEHGHVFRLGQRWREGVRSWLLKLNFNVALRPSATNGGHPQIHLWRDDGVCGCQLRRHANGTR